MADNRTEYTRCRLCDGKFYGIQRVALCEECMDREDHEAVERIRAFVREMRERQGRPVVGSPT